MSKQTPHQPGDQALVRQMNLSLIMHTLWAESPISRARLSQETKLNKTTVSDLVKELHEHGFVHEIGMQSSGAGRPGTLLSLNPSAGYIVSCEIGVDYLEVLATDFAPNVIWQVKEPTAMEASQSQVLDRMLILLREAVE